MSILDPKQDVAAAEAATDNLTEQITGRIVPAVEAAGMRLLAQFNADAKDREEQLFDRLEALIAELRASVDGTTLTTPGTSVTLKLGAPKDAVKLGGDGK